MRDASDRRAAGIASWTHSSTSSSARRDVLVLHGTERGAASLLADETREVETVAAVAGEREAADLHRAPRLNDPGIDRPLEVRVVVRREPLAHHVHLLRIATEVFPEQFGDFAFGLGCLLGDEIQKALERARERGHVERGPVVGPVLGFGGTVVDHSSPCE